MGYDLHSVYLDGFTRPEVSRKVVENCVEALRARGLVGHIDTVVFRGLSGAFIGIPLADKLNVPYCAVRKESSHSYGELEGLLGDNVLVVDDFIGTGETIRRIKTAVLEKKPSTNMAVLLYDMSEPPKWAVEELGIKLMGICFEKRKEVKKLIKGETK